MERASLTYPSPVTVLSQLLAPLLLGNTVASTVKTFPLIITTLDLMKEEHPRQKQQHHQIISAYLPSAHELTQTHTQIHQMLLFLGIAN